MGTNRAISADERKNRIKPLILVVDDDETFQKMFRLIADRLEVTTHMASCCVQAIEAMQTISFDLILMDYRMPEIDGFNCTQRIKVMKKFGCDVPIIAVTAHILPEHRAKCLEAGMDDLLSKPFTLEELTEKLTYWLQRRPSTSEFK